MARKYESYAGQLKRVRDYAVEEPGFTRSFLLWDLKQRGQEVSAQAADRAIKELLEMGTIKCIEDNGRGGKVYAYDPPTSSNVTRLRLPELDASRIGELAPVRGVEVAHTRARGSSGRPGRDRKRQEDGWRIKRARQGT